MIKRTIFYLFFTGFVGNVFALDSNSTCEDLGFADTPCACEFMKYNLKYDEAEAELRVTEEVKTSYGGVRLRSGYNCSNGASRYLRAEVKRNKNLVSCAVEVHGLQCADPDGNLVVLPRIEINLQGNQVVKEKQALSDVIEIIGGW